MVIQGFHFFLDDSTRNVQTKNKLIWENIPLMIVMICLFFMLFLSISQLPDHFFRGLYTGEFP